MMRYIEDPVSEFIIADRVNGGDSQSLTTLKVGLSADKLKTEVTKAPVSGAGKK